MQTFTELPFHFSEAHTAYLGCRAEADSSTAQGFGNGPADPTPPDDETSPLLFGQLHPEDAVPLSRADDGSIGASQIEGIGTGGGDKQAADAEAPGSQKRAGKGEAL